MKPLHSKLTRYKANYRQKGAVLVVSLMMMLLLTIIGVTAMNNVTMEERMAGNLRDGDLAFQAAESVLREGENWLSGLLAAPTLCNSPITSPATCDDVWDQGVLTDLSSQNTGWWSTNSRPGTNLTGLAAAPIFILEELNYVRDSLVIGQSTITGSDYYKVTARAVGGSQSATSILQTTFVKRFN